MLAPDSYSGRVLEEEEAQTLLSAGIAALSHLRLPYPIFIPVHDALRDAARGAALLPDGRVVHLESDSVHSSSLLEGWSSAAAQLEFLARRLRTHSPAAAAVCSELGQALLGLEDSEGDGIDAASLGQSQAHAGSGGALTSDETASGLRVVCAARRSYQVPVLRCEYGDGEASSAAEVELVTETWDDDAPWRPWAAEDDPLGEQTLLLFSFKNG